MTNPSSKKHIPIIVKLLAILISLLAIYGQDFDLVFREAIVNDFMSYVLIIPFFFVYIVYRKRKILQAIYSLDRTEQKRAIWTSQVVTGITLFTIGFLTYFFGSYTSHALEYHLLSFPFFLAGSIALVFNTETLKTLLFPIALLFFIQPYLIQLVNPFWADLSWISATTSYTLLRAIGIPAEFTAVIGVPTIEITTIDGTILPFTVGVASSGLNSFMGFSVFSIFVVYILREPLWKRVTLMLAGYPILLLLNTLRITIILGLAHQWGMAIAEIFHLTGGIVLIFIGTLLLLVVGEKIWKVKIRPVNLELSLCNYCNQSLRKGNKFCISCGRFLKNFSHVINRRYALKITFLILITSAFLLIQRPPIVLAKPPTEIDLTLISPEETKQLLPDIPDWSLEYLYRDTRVEDILKQDAALLFTYISQTAQDNSSQGYIFVGVQISASRHTWESSLVTWPASHGLPTATVFDLRDVQILQNPALIGRFFAYQRPQSNRTEAVLYWYERVPFKISSVWEMRNVQISIIAYTDELTRTGLISSPNDFKEVEHLYLPLAQSIASYWQPIKTSSYITTIISNYGDEILFMSGGLLAGTIILYALEKRRKRKANENAYRKLSSQYVETINIVQDTEKTKTPTLANLVATTHEKDGQQVDKEQFLKNLLEIEKTGLIKRSVISTQDEPIQIWKTQIHLKET
jgi:exosortase